ncbi:MAG: S9 family peptidase, partial [Thermomicrobiaceae bacterium]|nr:S9 family peptidase [Thermomicrobiaceae bacterium]
AEFGVPQWVFAQSQYDFLPDGRIACVYIQEGIAHLGLIRPGAHRVEPIDLPFTSLGSLRAGEGNRLWLLAASPTEAPTVVSLDLATGDVRRVRRSAASPPSPGYVSLPRSIAFPTEDGQTAYAFFYPPANQDFVGPPGEKPPLIVVSHGGPTSATRPELDLEYLFFTSRGFGVVDVNYGGSTGYGRAYRERLNGRWGIVDVDDCVNAARYLVERGEADPRRLIIRGGSAGGYTTLCALTFRDVFTAGSSYFGVADAEALARDTHKFESRYLDRLIGPYPEAREVYRERSPIHFTDRLSCPVILLQGLEDPVVPPSQAEAMAAALEAKGIPYAYVPFPGEQ